MENFKIEHILIPVDFSETSLLAIEHGAFMAKLCKAELTLIHVLEKNWTGFKIVPNAAMEDLSAFIDKIETKLNEISANIKEKYSIKPETICVNGNIFREITEAAKENKTNVIVMGTHGASGFEEFFIGSNTYKVVTKSSCPVLSVQTHAKRLGFSRIVLPIDDSSHSRQKVMHAVEMAKHYGSAIHILGLPDRDTDAKKFDIKLDQVQHFIEKNDIGYVRDTVQGRNPATLTMEYAKKVDADLIIIMTDQEENLTGFLLGTYAQQVVNHSKIPVLSITPEVGYIDYPDLSGDWRMS